ncbi:LacI family transcriptional regulator [Streptomyces sp. NBC_00433]
MSGDRRPTLSDVAHEVGVSAKTVSRVLNGDGPTSAKTREKVMEVVARLGFQPNLMARNIRRGSPDSTIGLVVPDMGNPFFGTVAGGIEDAVRERGLTLLMGSSAEDPAQERALIETFLSRRVSALVVVPSVGAHHDYLGGTSSGPPVVFLDRPGSGPASDRVVSSNRAGAQEGTAHLLAVGHRRIGFIGDLPAGLYTRRERLAGYRAALAGAGVPYDRHLVVSGHDQDASAAATERLLDLAEPPTALLAGNNFTAMGAVTALARRRRKDIALVAFDDLPLAEILEPPLTVIAQDPAALGAAAARTVLARLDGDRTRPRAEVVPTRLVLRGSGELPPR